MDNREPKERTISQIVHKYIYYGPSNLSLSPEEFELVVRWAYSRIRWGKSEHNEMCLRLNDVLEWLKLYLPQDGVSRFRLNTNGTMQPKENSVTVLPACKAGEQVWVDDQPQFTKAELEGPH